jgi:hypothetical protein
VAASGAKSSGGRGGEFRGEVKGADG